MQEALYYKSIDNSSVKCKLCPQECLIKNGQRGFCGVRKNISGKLLSEVYGKVSSINLDPIEKKPLYHFFSGKLILSIGTCGCNFACGFCQNHHISQTNINKCNFKNITTDQIIGEALKQNNNCGIAYTYNEPFVWYEFMYDIAEKAKAGGLVNVVVSNGYINPEPLARLLPVIDAFNIDLKAFDDSFYSKYTGGSLQPILKNLKTISKHKKHVEITCLIIPGLNDDKDKFKNMASWIASELGSGTPLHINRYFPRFKFNIDPTPVKTLYDLQDIAKAHLDNVYCGNI